MLTLDAQVHTYERDHPGRPWHARMHGEQEMTADMMVKAMDAVGVDGAILVSPFTVYRYDPSYALESYAAYPNRFGLVTPVDPADPAVVDKIDQWAAKDGTLAIRILLTFLELSDPADPGLNRVLIAAARHKFPVNIYGAQHLDLIGKLAARHPSTRLVIDHLGVNTYFEPPLPAEPFAQLPSVLALAAHDNIAIKISGACTLSREPYPHNDIWDPVRRIIDAYGLERCMWGTDWTRATRFLTFKQGIDVFRDTDRLTDRERAALMGGNLARIYNWSPKKN